jgi:hypothetical protein
MPVVRRFPESEQVAGECFRGLASHRADDPNGDASIARLAGAGRALRHERDHELGASWADASGAGQPPARQPQRARWLGLDPTLGKRPRLPLAPRKRARLR